MDEKLAPVLLLFGHLILLFNTDQKALGEIQKVVQVEENIVNGVSCQCANLLQFLLQRLQILQVMNILSFRLDQFSQYILSPGH